MKKLSISSDIKFDIESISLVSLIWATTCRRGSEGNATITVGVVDRGVEVIQQQVTI